MSKNIEEAIANEKAEYARAIAEMSVIIQREISMLESSRYAGENIGRMLQEHEKFRKRFEAEHKATISRLKAELDCVSARDVEGCWISPSQRDAQYGNKWWVLSSISDFKEAQEVKGCWGIASEIDSKEAQEAYEAIQAVAQLEQEAYEVNEAIQAVKNAQEAADREMAKACKVAQEAEDIELAKLLEIARLVEIAELEAWCD